MTQEQRRTLINIHDHHARHGVVPTIRELAAMENLKSTSAVWRRVQALLEMGELVSDHRPGHRSYRIAGQVDLAKVSTDRLRAELDRREAHNG